MRHKLAGMPFSPPRVVTDGAVAVRLARLFFSLQAIAGAGWWVLVFMVPSVRGATLGGLDPVLIAVLDIPLFVVCSALAAVGLRPRVWGEASWAALVAVPWTVFVAAAMAAYATITQDAGWGALLMLAAAGGSVVALTVLVLARVPSEWIVTGPFAFRTARASGRRRLLVQTGMQIVVFWATCLAVIPLAIVWFETRWRLHLPMPIVVTVAGGILFVAASGLGLWSAHAMSTVGRGTPLPSAQPRHLVIAGPYRFVRNPMALAGIAQGVAVGMLVGSWLVVLYAVSGSLVWNYLIRPHEEDDLAERFGAEFERYRDSVGVWWPR